MYQQGKDYVNRKGKLRNKIQQWEKILVVIVKTDQHADFLWYLATR